MRVPVVTTKVHKGKSLELDCERETITLLGPAGEPLGTVTWSSVIDLIRAAGEKSRPVESRTQPRAPLVVRVKYGTPEGRQMEGRASGIGGGGLFIESSAPLSIGTNLSLEFTLPDHPSEWLEAKGVVAWVCPKMDQYTSSPGMGVRFSKIADDARARILDVINSSRRAGQSG